MSGELPPLYGASSDDHGAYCVVSAITWACITGLIAMVRFALAWHRRLEVRWDDISFAIAAVSAVISVALYPVAVNAGLGRHIDELDAKSVSQYFKIIYAAQLIGIVAIACGKASAAFLSQRIALVKVRYLYAFLAADTAWAVFSLLATAFQCRLPYPWVLEPSDCPTRGYLQYVVTVLNMATDVVLSTWIIVPIWKIGMDQRDRILVISLFGIRVIIPCVAVGQLMSLGAVIKSSDQTWVNVSLALFNQAILNLSVILTAIPRINRLLYSLRDDLIIPRISDFELGEFYTQTEELKSPNPPTAADSKAPPYKAKRMLKLGKRQVVMRVEERERIHDPGAVGGCDTSVETDYTGSECPTMTNGS